MFPSTVAECLHNVGLALAIFGFLVVRRQVATGEERRHGLHKSFDFSDERKAAIPGQSTNLIRLRPNVSSMLTKRPVIREIVQKVPEVLRRVLPQEGICAER